MLKIVLGNKNYSSWSLRAWLALKHTGAPFEEIVVPLDQPDSAENIRRHSPSGRVPALIDGDLTVWDSLAISEYLAEKFPQAKLWPDDAKARAVARSICAEMHSGFTALRTEHAMKIKDRLPAKDVKPEVRADLQRLSDLWADARRRFGRGGPYLFGDYTNADAFFGPVATRVQTYSLPLDSEARAYVDALLADPALREWSDAAARENFVMARYERKT